ncbi:SpoIIE family protein phosphatase [Streptomyces sp. NPDC001812]|uniref:SpoIIE family protein phosphatase n=1 Tax=Streptomyces cathayae TaxID=3031124 RepID=A0ABY8JVR4_9ACTN|nr:SpoIIE family protein phosphatase [Streptomyces sp. HUAS 5]WGD38771.1 SpoIIE family protein phosphatase [Streptomyces sp. HUAS 5]
MSAPDEALQPGFPHAVLHALGTGVFTVDTSGRITFVNPWTERLLGRPAARMIGRDAHDLLHRRPDGGPVPRDQCSIMALLRSGRPAEEGSDEYFLRDDGTTVPIIWATTPLLLAGRRAGLVVVFNDFSLHRDAEEQAAAHTAALEALTTRLNLVADVSSVLMSATATPQRIAQLLRLLVPAFGDWAAVDLRSERDRAAGTLERVAVRSHTHPRRARRLEGPLPPPPSGSRPARARTTGGDDTVLLSAAEVLGDPGAPLAATHRPLFDRLGGRSALVVPLRARRRHYGMLTVARAGDSPDLTDSEILLLNDIGRRLALVLDNARLYHEQRNVAETMQRQLLTPLPQVDHLRMAARYLPAQRAMEIGGDWYDAFLLSDGVVALVIGDVVGHDLEAASHMAEVRNMLRALAWNHREPPSVILQDLDEAVTNTSDAPMATLVFARVEGPEGGPWQLHWANAGHPPPLLVTDEGDTHFLTSHGPLIGMSAALHLGLEWPDTYVELPPGSTLLLYTDGLVESRGRPIDLGMAKLRHHASMLTGRTVDGFCDELLARIDPSGDDVALLALRLPPAGAGAPGDSRPPPPPQSPYSPAAPNRAAPGSVQLDAPVEDPTRGAREESPGGLPTE